MDDATLARLDAFLRPLYQDLDGASHLEEVVRVAAIARRLAPELTGTTLFELMLRLHPLGSRFDRSGNASRAALTTGISESDLRSATASVRRLGDPGSAEERVLAAAIVIDAGGVRGLAERFARARREGRSVVDVARDALEERSLPEWLPAAAVPLLAARHAAREAFCRAIIDESG